MKKREENMIKADWLLSILWVEIVFKFLGFFYKEYFWNLE